MEMSIQIPDSVAQRLSSEGKNVSRWLLERAGIEAKKAGEITSFELRQMLGIESRYELDGFLKEHGVYFEYSDEDLQYINVNYKLRIRTKSGDE
jgi:hypothetical protein